MVPSLCWHLGKLASVTKQPRSGCGIFRVSGDESLSNGNLQSTKIREPQKGG